MQATVMTEQSWITFSQAVRLFKESGSSESSFSRCVREGLIEHRPIEGKKRGSFYNQGDVYNALEGKVKTTLRLIHARQQNDLQTATFHPATPDDMPELATLIEEIFGGEVNVERWRERIEKNPETGFLLREGSTGTGKVVGCEFIYPHTEAHVRQILCNYVSLVSTPDDILTYTPGQHVNLYLRTVGITPSVSVLQKRHWAAILVRNCMKFVEALGRRGVIIDNIWSRSETKDGVNILRHMGFTQIESNNAYKNFVIHLPESGLPMMIRYKKAYQEWQQKNSGEVG